MLPEGLIWVLEHTECSRGGGWDIAGFARFSQLDLGWELVSKAALEQGASLNSCAFSISQQKQGWIENKVHAENTED